ncbi:hypothetical protein KBC31_01065 [Candidatus Saccharibacteria bacterium]|jgi:hypothetical protein|nr:hypothetical protein [Candidatus Saccharibacteria bacterium]
MSNSPEQEPAPNPDVISRETTARIDRLTQLVTGKDECSILAQKIGGLVEKADRKTSIEAIGVDGCPIEVQRIGEQISLPIIERDRKMLASFCVGPKTQSKAEDLDGRSSTSTEFGLLIWVEESNTGFLHIPLVKFIDPKLHDMKCTIALLTTFGATEQDTGEIDMVATEIEQQERYGQIIVDEEGKPMPILKKEYLKQIDAALQAAIDGNLNRSELIKTTFGQLLANPLIEEMQMQHVLKSPSGKTNYISGEQPHVLAKLERVAASVARFLSHHGAEDKQVVVDAFERFDDRLVRQRPNSTEGPDAVVSIDSGGLSFRIKPIGADNLVELERYPYAAATLEKTEGNCASIAQAPEVTLTVGDSGVVFEVLQKAQEKRTRIQKNSPTEIRAMSEDSAEKFGKQVEMLSSVISAAEFQKINKKMVAIISAEKQRLAKVGQESILDLGSIDISGVIFPEAANEFLRGVSEVKIKVKANKTVNVLTECSDLVDCEVEGANNAFEYCGGLVDCAAIDSKRAFCNSRALGSQKIGLKNCSALNGPECKGDSAFVLDYETSFDPSSVRRVEGSMANNFSRAFSRSANIEKATSRSRFNPLEQKECIAEECGVAYSVFNADVLNRRLGYCGMTVEDSSAVNCNNVGIIGLNNLFRGRNFSYFYSVVKDWKDLPNIKLKGNGIQIISDRTTLFDKSKRHETRLGKEKDFSMRRMWKTQQARLKTVYVQSS